MSIQLFWDSLGVRFSFTVHEDQRLWDLYSTESNLFYRKRKLLIFHTGLLAKHSWIFLKKIGWDKSWGHWYPCFVLLVTYVLGFKAMVNPLHAFSVILRFTSGVTPADCIEVSMATSIGGGSGLKPMTVHVANTGLYTIRPLRLGWNSWFQFRPAEGKRHMKAWNYYHVRKTSKTKNINQDTNIMRTLTQYMSSICFEEILLKGIISLLGMACIHRCALLIS